MSAPRHDVEDRLPGALRGLADDLDAPATARARQGIARRTDRLERRRRTRATGAGALCLALVVVSAGLWLRNEEDVRTGPIAPLPRTQPVPGGDFPLPGGTPDHLPAFTVEGLDVADVHEGPDPAAAFDPPGESGQLFRREGDTLGPFLKVHVSPAGAAPTEIEGDRAVAIGRAGGRIDVDGYHVTVVWDVGDGTAVRIDSAWVGEEATLDFARGLRPRGIEQDAGATVLPMGLSELRGGPEIPPSSVQRTVTLRSPRPDTFGDIVIRHGGEREFLEIYTALLQGSGENSSTIAFGRPAMMITKESGEVRLLWRHTTTDIVELEVIASDPTTVTRLLEGVAELDDAEWEQLKAEVDN